MRLTVWPLPGQMTARLTLTLLLALVAPSAVAGERCTYPQRSSAPRHVEAAIPETHQISCRLNPFYLRAEFDGDGMTDVAILVVEKKTGRDGIAVIHTGDAHVSLLGAGQALGNGGDDFSWMDAWSVRAAPKQGNVFEDPLPEFTGEVLYVEKSESASAYIGWTGERFEWYQSGD